MKRITLAAMLTALLAQAAVTAFSAGAPGQVPATTPAAAPSIKLDWYSVNGGGITLGSSATSKLGLSVGQSVAGVGTSASFKLGIGFWQGAGSFCAMLGDLSGDGILDIVDLAAGVNYVVFGTPIPTGEVCGDLTGDGVIDITDLICLLNFVVFGNPIPC